MGFTVAGIWNERLGWVLLLAGWLGAVGLDPWSLSERNPASLAGSSRMAARQAQAVILAMGFLQLAVARLLRDSGLSARLAWTTAWLTAVGTLVYAAGYTGKVLAGPPWLIPVGAAVNLLAFLLLLAGSVFRTSIPERRVVLAVFCLGMVLDIVMGLYASDPTDFLPRGIGPEDGVRQRMLRLARVAAIALPLTVLLFRDLSARSDSTSPWKWRGRLALMVGAAGMPAILAAACFFRLEIKYLLPIPALSTTAGVLIGFGVARKSARPLEQWGWA